MGTQNYPSGSERLKPGKEVYSEAGRLLGRVSGIGDGTFEVEKAGGDEPVGASGEEFSGPEFGEGYIMWRCEDCGEMGELEDGFPESCPDCSAPKEVISATLED